MFVASLLLWSESFIIFNGNSLFYKNNCILVSVSIYMQGWQILYIHYFKTKLLTPIEEASSEILLATLP